ADLRALLSDATAQHADPLDLLSSRRAARVLRVARPGLLPLPGELQIEAMRAVPAILRAIDTLDRASRSRLAARASAPVLGPFFAQRLAVVARERPPLAQITVTLGTFAQALGGATNEETLTAGAVDAAAGSDSSRR